MKDYIVLVGGGGHCRSVIDVIEQQNKYKILGIIEKQGISFSKVLGYEIIGFNKDIEKIYKTCQNAVITMGGVYSNKIRVSFFHQLKTIGFNLPAIVSPLAYVSKHALISEGSIVMHHALVNSNAKIGKNCIINTKALIEHDAIIGDHCHISTGAVINGGVVVKSNSFYGSNATSKEYITTSGFIKAGAVAVSEKLKNN